MEKRHAFALENRLEGVVHRGWAEFEWWELYLWYEAQRIGKKTWRDILERLLELVAEKGASVDDHLHEQFAIIEGQSGVLVIYNAPNRDLVRLATRAEYEPPFSLLS